MNFSTNMKYIRTTKGYSQEQLAETLFVSRQAISKWESGNGFPEMDTLIKLSELFECSVDALLKEDLTQHVWEEKVRYDTHYNTVSKGFTLAIFSILFAVALYPLLELPFPKASTFELIPALVFMCMIMVGVVFFIYYGMQDSNFIKKYPQAPDNVYSEQEQAAFQKKFTLAMCVGVATILFMVAMYELIRSISHENIASFLFMAGVSFSVSLFVYYGNQYRKYNPESQNGGKSVEKTKKKDSITDAICGCIMMVATIVFLLSGFLLNAWGSAWIVFPIGGISCGIVSVVVDVIYQK